MYWLLGGKSQLSIEMCRCTKQSLNQRGFTVSNFGAQPPIQTWKYVRDEIKNLCQRYADRLEKRSNTQATPKHHAD